MDPPIVIIGGGIIGFSTGVSQSSFCRVFALINRSHLAYQLVELGHDPASIHIVEAADEFFCGASGYAGGFIASDW